MILIRTKLRNIRVDKNKLKKIIQTMLEVLDYQDFDIGILLTTNATIRKYNRDFRNKDCPTDILSFPFHPEINAGQRIEIKSPEDKNLGDIIISLEYVEQKAPEWNRTFEQHLKVLFAHGIAHLLNYDHQTDEEFKVMNKVEKKLLKALKIL